LVEHYYTPSPGAESRPKHWTAVLRGRELRFKTDAGVFSKGEVDFGTRLLIESFRPIGPAGGKLLDAGCGYGPIGLALAAELKGSVVHLVDVNQRALELARENAKINGIGNVRIYASDRLDGVGETGFAAVLTNPPIRAGKRVVEGIFGQSLEKLAPGGELWAVIRRRQGAPSAMEKLREIFGNAEMVERKKGYCILRSIKNG
jgi:16S rRNA (guanine1207-N2)-methyltransferase